LCPQSSIYFTEYQEQLESAAKALIAALKDNGIAAKESDSPIVSVNKDAIRRWIGEKRE
jgi:hypothetical protein